MFDKAVKAFIIIILIFGYLSFCFIERLRIRPKTENPTRIPKLTTGSRFNFLKSVGTNDAGIRIRLRVLKFKPKCFFPKNAPTKADDAVGLNP